MPEDTKLIPKAIEEVCDTKFSVQENKDLTLETLFNGKMVSGLLMNLAYNLSLKTNYPCPFFLEATRNNIDDIKEGKRDDITVIAAMVTSDVPGNDKVKEQEEWRN